MKVKAKRNELGEIEVNTTDLSNKLYELYMETTSRTALEFCDEVAFHKIIIEIEE